APAKPATKTAAKPATKSAEKPAAAAKPAKATAPKAASKTSAKAAKEDSPSREHVVAPRQPMSAARPATHKAAPATHMPPPPPPRIEDSRPITKAVGAHRTGFRALEFIVYPAHGVGQILAIEEQDVAGFKLELFVINFAKDKMTLKVPLPKVISGAIRKLSDNDTVRKSLDTLMGRARVKRTMWSRRAQEYEAKINSGDLSAIAEVVRDLYRSEAQPEQSYSERQLYESALDRMTREIAAVMKLTETEALKLIEGQLQKGPKRGGKAEADAEAGTDLETADEGDIEQAA
ncbi:MAG: transcriptional regulator, CarD family, partial [Candidatus Saccharibacteria bacterium]|nr:transcriptional regulator, CarD family [Candidatus Saccharibacteria bacterium]